MPQGLDQISKMKKLLTAILEHFFCEQLNYSFGLQYAKQKLTIENRKYVIISNATG